MKNIIEIDSLNYSYKDTLVFDNISLSIKEGSFVTVVGVSGCGKTTLVKLILGLIKGNSVIMCEGLPVVDYHLKVLRKDVGVIYGNIEDSFVNETVMDEIAFNLENLNLAKEEINKRIISISNKLKIKNILEKNPHHITQEEKWLVALASSLVMRPNILIIDDGFSSLSPKKRIIVLSLLEKLNIKGMTIINFSSNIEETLYGSEIIVLSEGKVLLSGSKEEVLGAEEILEEIGVGVPFIVSLSNKLGFYNLTKKIYLSEKELVDALWK